MLGNLLPICKIGAGTGHHFRMEDPGYYAIQTEQPSEADRCYRRQYLPLFVHTTTPGSQLKYKTAGGHYLIKLL